MKRLSEWIRATATKSGHPDMIFGLISVVVAAFVVLVLRGLLG
jgi:hypothetical protein